MLELNVSRRRKVLQQIRRYDYEFAKEIDPAAVIAYEVKANHERLEARLGNAQRQTTNSNR